MSGCFFNIENKEVQDKYSGSKSKLKMTSDKTLKNS